MYGDLFDKLKIWSTNKDERSKFLNRVGEETSARDSFYAIIRTAIKDRASDVHIEQPSEGVCQIRYRIDGVLRKGSHKIRNPRSLIVVSKTDANMDISESRLPQDGAITFEKSVATSQNIPVGYSLRVSTMPTQYGEKVVMRLLHRDKRFDLTDLGYPQDIYQKVLQQISVPYGLILITGPTGSGKTTTLYSILQHLNTEDVNIVTIEEPIEMPLNGINQSQVNRAINWDFSSSLRNYLRQDPDIILVGEIRDGETAKTAMEAAKTGHLVLSTLHTNDAVSSLLRLYELGVANSDLQSSLQCIVAQRLVRSLCNKCKTSYDAKDDINNLLGAEVAQHFFPLYTTPSEHKIPCLDCSDIGYKGRLPITELWVVGDQEKQMIYDGCRDYQKYLSIAMRDGMVPLVVSGIQSVLEGKTTLHEIGKHVPIEHFLKRRDLIVEAINSYFAKFPK
jgi:type IV pilus assembly protein PilB